MQVVLVAHSQGTIIAGDALRRLSQAVEDGKLAEVSTRPAIVPSFMNQTNTLIDTVVSDRLPEVFR